MNKKREARLARLNWRVNNDGLTHDSARFRYGMIDACLSPWDKLALWVLMAFALYGVFKLP